MIFLGDYVKLDKAEVRSLLIDGYSFDYIDSDDAIEAWSVVANHDVDMVPSIFVDGEIVDVLEDENHFEAEDNRIRITGRPKTMTRQMYGDYLHAQEKANLDAEHDARATTNATAGIFRPSY